MLTLFGQSCPIAPLSFALRCLCFEARSLTPHLNLWTSSLFTLIMHIFNDKRLCFPPTQHAKHWPLMTFILKWVPLQDVAPLLSDCSISILSSQCFSWFQPALWGREWSLLFSPRSELKANLAVSKKVMTLSDVSLLHQSEIWWVNQLFNECMSYFMQASEFQSWFILRTSWAASEKHVFPRSHCRIFGFILFIFTLNLSRWQSNKFRNTWNGLKYG